MLAKFINAGRMVARVFSSSQRHCLFARITHASSVEGLKKKPSASNVAAGVIFVPVTNVPTRLA
jgi:hypothetical protein